MSREEIAVGDLDSSGRDQEVRAQQRPNPPTQTGEGDEKAATEPQAARCDHDEQVDVVARDDVVHRQGAGDGDHADEREPADDAQVAPGRSPEVASGRLARLSPCQQLPTAAEVADLALDGHPPGSAATCQRLPDSGFTGWHSDQETVNLGN